MPELFSITAASTWDTGRGAFLASSLSKMARGEDFHDVPSAVPRRPELPLQPSAFRDLGEMPAPEEVHGQPALL